MNDEYKYEVAFTFLTRDESLAQQLNDLLQERISTFIYPERQLEIAGKDGEIALKKAFGLEARVVVILYREEWGTTPWTRIEQDAIRERGYHHGYDFSLLIPLNNPPTKPEWFPPHRFWIGLDRWGVEAAAAVIEARVQEAGGVTREESLVQRKDRLERQIVSAEKRKDFLESGAAVQPANEEAERVLKTIEEMSKSLSTSSFPLQCTRERDGVKIQSFGFILQTYWQKVYSNVLDRSGFFLRMLQLDTNERYDQITKEILVSQFQFSMNEVEQYGWSAISGKKEFYSSKELAEFALRLLLDRVATLRQNQANQIRNI